ncbi:MAG TPA: tRNA lysidine(34) synthetase TilS [Candidatus Babeliales bacterium]|nr:tRNA lysidine(34) synthetase TilS [Candidatus Babeliales bacterium]
MDQFLIEIDNFIQKNRLIGTGDTIIAGLSGGPDSVFLLHLLERYRKTHAINIIAAHLNHEWREDAQKDTDLSKDLCLALGIPLVVKKASELQISIKNNGSKEEVARKLRRFFFEQLAAEHSAHSIALGHHANDQQETFFMRLIRGATLSGLTCMKPKDGLYIRPLLQTPKPDIISYLETNNILYAYDSTNESDAFLRNRIRTSVIPAICLADSRFEKQFSRTLNHLQETESFLDDMTEVVFENLTRKGNESWQVDLEQFRHLHPFMKKRLLVHWLIVEEASMVLTEQFLDEIIRFLESSDKKSHALHHAWLINRTENWFFLSKP